MLVSEIFADRICQLCASDLTVFSNLRDDLISKQKSLYLLAGIEESCFNLNSNSQAFEEAEFIEEQSDYEMNFETIEQYDESGNVYMEEDDNECITDPDESVQGEDATAAETIVRIEKIEVKSESHDVIIRETVEGNSFDLFEEVVGSESEDQKYMTIFEQ